MAVRLSLEPEIIALLKAIQKRIETLPGITNEKRDGFDVYIRGPHAFLQMEIKRDFLSLDLWLDDVQIEESRASGIARAHPFLGEDAIKIRFERATDLARVARWIEHSHAYAPRREDRQKERVLERKQAEAEALRQAAAEAIRLTEEANKRAAALAAKKAADEQNRKLAEARAQAGRASAPEVDDRAKVTYAAGSKAPAKKVMNGKAASAKKAPKAPTKTTKKAKSAPKTTKAKPSGHSAKSSSATKSKATSGSQRAVGKTSRAKAR